MSHLQSWWRQRRFPVRQLAVPRLIKHLERYLGPIEEGWASDVDGKSLGFQVTRFSPESLAGCSAYSTLGLSQYELVSRTSSRRIRQELVMLVSDRGRSLPVAGLLQQVGTELIEAGSALLRGDVIGPRGRLFDRSQMEALYAAIPVYLPDGFGQVDDIVIVWLVPVSRPEADFVSTSGWPKFEERLIDVDPDLTDVHRRSIFV